MANMPGGGVFLCRCNGRVTSRLSLEAVRSWLQEMHPGISVVIGDNLCQSHTMSQVIQENQVLPAVVAGCSHLNSEIGLWREPDKGPFDPNSIGTVDLVREVVSACDDADLNRRVRVLLWAQVKRQQKFSGVPASARTVRFGRAQGEISRRDLFGSFLPKYRVIPYVEPALCLGEKCRICRAGCDSRAISVQAEAIKIEASDCRGCGVCTTLCPRQAIIYPNFSPDQLEAEIEGLLLDCAGQPWRRSIAFVCRSSRHPEFDASVLPVSVPCLGMVSPGLILRALDRGAQGIMLISSNDSCQMKLDCSNWKGTVQFVQRLLHHWGLESERVTALDERDLARQLAPSSDTIARLAPMSFTASQSTALPDKALGLPAAILAMSEKLGAKATGEIAAGTVPFGKIVLDAARCTGCGVCAAQCPTNALADLKVDGSCQLVFRQESCVGCGQCVDCCPERCLQMVKVLDVGKLSREPQLVFQGDFAHCSVCGTPFAPRAMVESVRARLGTTGQAALRLEMCPKCRMKGKVRPTKSGAGV